MKTRSALAALFSVHLLLALSLVSPGVLFGPEPIARADYALHFSRAAAAEQFLSRFHRISGYSPDFMAGYPAGTVFDVNNHFIEVFVFVLHRLGVPQPSAFNGLVFLAILLPPLVIWLTARNFRLTDGQQLAAAALASALWFTDQQVARTWSIGVIASGMAMYVLPYSLSCWQRYAEERSGARALAFLASAGLSSLLHPLSFLFFYGSAALYFLIRIRRLDRAAWTVLVIFIAIVMLLNAFWIVPLLQHLHLKTQSGYHWIGNVQKLIADLFGTRDSGLRLVIYVLGAGGLMAWWRDARREAVLVLLIPASVLTLFGYIGGEIPLFVDLETYRNNLVVSFLLIIPAAVGGGDAAAWLRGAPDRRRWVLVAVTLVVGSHLIGRNLLWVSPYLRGKFSEYALEPLGSAEMSVIAWLRERASDDRRVMIEHWPLGALVPWYTGLQVIGGPYPLVWMPHNFVNFTPLGRARSPRAVQFFGGRLPDLARTEADAYLEAYNVGWIVSYTPVSRTFFDGDRDLAPVADFGRYRIYENRRPASFFLRGSGSVKADYGSLGITNASPGGLVLKYHWSPSLVTEPPQEIRPYPVLDDPVPFIEVPDNRFTEFRIGERSVLR